MAGACEYGNELSDFIKCGEFLSKMYFTLMYVYKHSGIHQAYMKVVVTDNDPTFNIKLFIRE